MPESRNHALRRAAADLATMAAADRDWLLERLSAAERQRLHAALEPARFDDSMNALSEPGEPRQVEAATDRAAINATSAARQRVLSALASNPSDGWLLSRVVTALPASDRALAMQHAGMRQAQVGISTTRAPSMLDIALRDAVDALGATLPDPITPPDQPESLLRRLLRKVNR